MASSLPSCTILFKPASLNLISTRQALQVRARSFRDEGISGDMVEANLRVLRERIEEVKNKERLERCCRCEYGWNYPSGYNYKLKKQVGLSQVFDLIGLVCRTIGFTCVSGSLILVLVSLIVHLNQ
ncbi:hypothetical protein P3X46_029478 [Hevea brasiliensis]|uniref:Uncharacterized protein n=1 Tax=Hevea brasiliensis TaxID=3981 RepID=A0ABQ9KSC7_HEVBR|nr:uncharacterized protein LOC110658969 [Hevea brasiliensis]KAJ9147301.1 hypothetical protein P3X46_029478 [Hevea brasiliensis]